MLKASSVDVKQSCKLILMKKSSCRQAFVRTPSAPRACVCLIQTVGLPRASVAQ